MYDGDNGVSIFPIAQIIFNAIVLVAIALIILILKEMLRALHELSREVYKSHDIPNTK